LRTLEPGGSAEVDYNGGGFPEVIARDEEMQAGVTAAAGKAMLRNDSTKRLTLLIERCD
jgi:hypothetical protein